jgi:hypothetical protein
VGEIFTHPIYHNYDAIIRVKLICVCVYNRGRYTVQMRQCNSDTSSSVTLNPQLKLNRFIYRIGKTKRNPTQRMNESFSRISANKIKTYRLEKQRI